MNETPKVEPKMRDRKRAPIYQYYRDWCELVELRKRHDNILRQIKANKSNMDAHLEEIFLEELQLDKWIDQYKKNMIAFSKLLAPDIHNWLTSIGGIGDATAAKLIGELDDIARFDTISKLWRFAGYAVIDGKREHYVKGQTATYNKRLKSLVFMIGDEFVKHQTSPYIKIYYEEKKRQRELHPEKIKIDGKWKFNDGHLHYRAIDKMVKIFLSHVWLVWRQAEGLKISQPYSAQILGHSNIIDPPGYSFE